MAVGDNTEGTNAFSDIKFDNHVKRMLDVGGGKLVLSKILKQVDSVLFLDVIKLRVRRIASRQGHPQHLASVLF